MKNVIGKKFGMLTVISDGERNRSGRKQLLCQCECGNTVNVLKSNLERGTTSSCGCLKKKLTSERSRLDLGGQKFGRLTALYRGNKDKQGQYFWHCRCDCGNEVDVRGTSLKKGITISCGCYNKERVSETKAINLANIKFGKLTAVSFDRELKKWKCQCDCGNISYVSTSGLRIGSTRSCGCLLRDVIYKKSVNKYVGRRFTKLVVVSVEVLNDDKGFRYKCKCDCGNYIYTTVGNLVSGNTKSCGCLDISHGGSSKEIIIREQLESYFGMKSEKSKILGGKEIDIYFPDIKFGVEYNGSAFHASENGVFYNLPKNYHMDKFKKAKELGITLCTVFEWEDIEVAIQKILDVYNNNSQFSKAEVEIQNQYPVIPSGYKFSYYKEPIPHIDGKFTVYDCGSSVYIRR